MVVGDAADVAAVGSHHVDLERRAVAIQMAAALEVPVAGQGDHRPVGRPHWLGLERSGAREEAQRESPRCRSGVRPRVRAGAR